VTLLALAACAHLRYEPVLWPLPEAPDRAILEADLSRRLASGRLPAWTLDGVDLPSPAGVDADALWVTWWTAGRADRGIELDLRIGDHLVEVTRARDGATALRTATAGPEVAPTTAALLAARYGVRAVSGDKAWSQAELGQIARALDALTPPERARVVDVVWVRATTSPRSPDDELAWYTPSPATIEVYDTAFRDEGSGFVGAPTAPWSPAASTALHELGHAVADSAARAAFIAYEQHPSNAAWRVFRATARATDPVRAFRRWWTPPGPTTYGAWRAHEAYAEAFLLAHADPDALARISPALARWFAAGDHLPLPLRTP
jgi:hypothetical protein